MARKKIYQINSTFAIAMNIAVLAVVLVGVVSFFKKPQTSCANSISCLGDLSGEFQKGRESVYMGKSVATPQYLSRTQEARRVLGDTSEEKHIFVDLSRQLLTAYEGKHLVMSFPVATGKWGRTPTGDFHIWIKLRYTHMEGGNPADGTYYSLHNVPYTMFFYNSEVPKERGFALHGAFWHNNYGHPMSHGCVNIRPEDAAELFAWADPVSSGGTTYASDDNPGTRITIYGETPDE